MFINVIKFKRKVAEVSLVVRAPDSRQEGLATRGLLATDHVILNHGQVTWTTPELAPPLLTTTPNQRGPAVRGKKLGFA
ncbi:hypothetical protein TNCV_3371851 [Trichonephila clavipes]|nr:hypothetical protein TNCV_3371851 [Trichonephila clavipes]